MGRQARRRKGPSVLTAERKSRCGAGPEVWGSEELVGGASSLGVEGTVPPQVLSVCVTGVHTQLVEYTGTKKIENTNKIECNPETEE